MNEFLTINKILKDSVALYRAHFLYITTLFSAVIIPYTLLLRLETLPDGIIFVIPIFLLLMMLVEIVSTKLVCTSYVDIEFVISKQLKNSLPTVLPYTIITFMALFVTFFGFSIFIIPGILGSIFFNMLKVDFIINNGTIRERIKSTVELFKGGSFSKIIKIYILPIVLQFALGFLISSFLQAETLEQDIERLFPFMTAGIIIFFPISVCFKTAIYYNNIKQRQLQTSNELV